MEYININTGTKPYLLVINGFLSPNSNLDNFIKHFKIKYNILLPLLPGTDNKPCDFVDLTSLVQDIENYCSTNNIKIEYLYGVSMGGVIASLVTTRQIIKPKVLIMESSPILGFNNIMTKLLTREYIIMCDKLRKGDKKLITKACNTILRDPSLISDFTTLLNNTSNDDIKNYISEINKYKMTVTKLDTKICYIYGSSFNELFMRRCSKFIKKNYKNSLVTKIKGDHLEMALFDEKNHHKIIENLLNQELS